MTSTASSLSSLYAGSASEAPVELSSALPSHVSSTLHEALSSEKLDRCIALQSRTSGLIHAQSSALKDLNSEAEREFASLKQEFADGIKLAKSLKADLKDMQRRIEICEQLAKKKIPVEYHNTRDRLTHLADDDSSNFQE